MGAFSLSTSATAAQAAVFLLVSLCIGGVLLALRPARSAKSGLDNRIQAIARQKSAKRRREDSEESRRRRMLEDTLRELEAKHSARARKRAKPTLRGRLRQAGLSWSRKTYVSVCVMAGIAVYATVLSVSGLGIAPATGFGLAAGLLAPHFYVARKRRTRLSRFTKEFPNALDVIVRGVKAGLPLVDCLKIIAAEAQEPVRSEFRALVHDQTVGMPLDEAVERLAQRVPLSQTNFFAIVLTIQSRTGGNLSEALGNLSKVLRERKNLGEKIKAMSAEAKASGGIIAAMPVIVAVLLYFSSPDYISLLVTTSTGKITLVACAVWMFMGTMVMRKMINFDF